MIILSGNTDGVTKHADTAGLKASRECFVSAWGDMASNWGINKTMARIHAHLMSSEAALSTDEIMETLAISRGNANMTSARSSTGA